MGRDAPKVWIRKRQTSNGISYSLRWREKGQMRSESLGRIGRERADRMRIRKEYELAFGKTDKEPEDISWPDFVQDHLRFCKAKKAEATYLIEERLLRQVGEYLNPTQLSDLTYSRLEAFFTHRRLNDGVSPANLNKQIRTLRSILTRAVRHNYLDENRADGLALWGEPEKSNRVPTAEEVEKLLHAAPTAQWRAFIHLAAGGGLRVGELCNLRWRDVQLEKGLLTVSNRSHWQTKSRKNRILGLNGRAIGLLEEVKRETGGGEYVLVTGRGSQWRNNIKRNFGRIVKKAQIEPCTPHDLRRTFCTEVSKRVSPKVLKELAGHSDIKVTEKYYLADVQEQQVKEAAECLPY